MRDHAPAIPRLGVPKYDWWNESLHGVAFGGYATNFPQVIGMAATWDTISSIRWGRSPRQKRERSITRRCAKIITKCSSDSPLGAEREHLPRIRAGDVGRKLTVKIRSLLDAWRSRSSAECRATTEILQGRLDAEAFCRSQLANRYATASTRKPPPRSRRYLSAGVSRGSN